MSQVPGLYFLEALSYDLAAPVTGGSNIASGVIGTAIVRRGFQGWHVPTTVDIAVALPF